MYLRTSEAPNSEKQPTSLQPWLTSKRCWWVLIRSQKKICPGTGMWESWTILKVIVRSSVCGVMSFFFLCILISEYGYDDVYGRSLDDEVAVSPNTAGEHVVSLSSIHKTEHLMCKCQLFIFWREGADPGVATLPVPNCLSIIDFLIRQLALSQAWVNGTSSKQWMHECG